MKRLIFYLKITTILLTIGLIGYNPDVLFKTLPFISSTSSTQKMPQSQVDQILSRSLPEKELAEQIAQSLNDSWSMDELNQWFLDELNDKRQEEGLPFIEVNFSLRESSQEYVQDLIDYRYLESTTPEGLDFRVYFPHVEEAPYRLSSYLYELYIPLRDIRLSTWQTHPEVLIYFLLEQWQTHIYPEVTGQYFAIQTKEEWNDQHEEYYIRMVGVLITDTSHVQYD